MPDSEITLKDIWAKQIVIETLLRELLSRSKSLEDTGIMKDDDVNPFVNPDTGLNDINYYRSEHPKEEGKR